MRFAHALALAGLASAAAVPRQEGSSCADPVKRAEFRSLDAAARKQYFAAVNCLASKPSSLGLETTLYDDFTYVHSHLADKIHYVASFLPWHRYFTHLYERQLQACGWAGPMPYWDWTRDAADAAGSDFWDAETGVGGNGGDGDDARFEETADGRKWRCLIDGPFKDLRPAYSKTEYQPHCLSRDFYDGTNRPGTMRSEAYTAEAVAEVLALGTFEDFEFDLENNPHNSIHSGVGGQFGDIGPNSSPNDPIFFLHHAQVDRLWYLWQQADPAARQVDYSGIRERLALGGANGTDANATAGGNATAADELRPRAALTDLLEFMGLADDVSVAQVMTTKNDLLCYEY